MKWETVVEWLGKILGMVLPVLTPSIKDELFSFLKKLHEKAVETDNPIDDFLTQFLLDIFGVE